MSRTARLWITVAPAAIAAAAIVTALILTSDHQDLPVLSIALGGLTGLSFIAAGLIARTRRPLNRTGLLLIGVGFFWFAAGLTTSDVSVIWTVGLTVSPLFVAVLVHLLLAYPSGRLGTRWERIVVAIGYGLAASANLLLLPFDRRPIESCDDCPSNAFLVNENDTVAAVLTGVVETSAFVFLLAVVVTLALRWRRSSPAARRALTPVLVAGAATLLLLGVSIGTQDLWPAVGEAFGWAANFAFMAVPFLFLWGVMQSRLARSDVSRALAEEPEGAEGAQERVRGLLHDPSAELLLWRESPQAGYADIEGNPRDPAAGEPGRATTTIERDGRPLAALTHDEALLDEPELLEQVAAALRLAIERDQNVIALQASERRSRALLEALPDNMYRISRDGVYLDVHAKDPTQLRLPAERFVGSTIWDYPVPRQTSETLMAAAKLAFETGSVETFEFEAVTEDGTLLHREGRVTPSGPDEFLLITRDITARKEAEQALQSSEARSRALLEAIPDNMFRLSRDGIFLDYHSNERTPLMDPESIVGASVHDYPVPRELVERIMAAAEIAFETGTRQTIEYELDDERGFRYQEARITPSGKDEFFVVVRDVTDRKQSEEDLKSSEQRSRALLEAIPDSMFRISFDGRIRDYRIEPPIRIFRSEEDMTGSDVYDADFPREITDRTMELGRKSIETGELQVHEYAIEIDSELQHQEARISPSGDDEFVLIVRDVTERKRQEEELRLSGQRSRALLQAIPDVMYRVSREGTFLDVHATDLTPMMDPDTIVGANVYDYPIPRELMDRFMAAAEAAFETGDRQTIEFVLDDEHGVRYQEARITPSGATEFFVVVRDVTDRRQQEIELQAERDFVAKVVNLAPTYFCVIHADGRVIRYNDTLAQATGHVDDDTVRGSPFRDVFVLPEQVEEFERVLATANAGGAPGEFVLNLRSVSGDLLDVLWRGVDIYDETAERRYLLCGLDVTERARHRQDLERRSEFLSAIGDATPAFLCVILADGRLSPDPINKALRDASGYTTEEAAGARFTELFIPEEQVKDVQRRITSVVESGEPREYESEWLLKDGSRMLVAWTCTPLPEVLELTSYLISGVDVTERARQQEEQAALRRVAVAVASERRAEDVFGVVTEEVGRLLGAHTANLVRFEPEDEIVIVGRWSEAGVHAYDVGTRVPLLGGPVTMVHETGRPVRVDLDSVPADFAERLREQGVNSVVAAPITVSGRLWGAVSVSLTPPDSFLPGSEERVAEFTRLVSLALANAEARADLAAQRARIVTAGDEERRRLERNLHDGAQQRLVSLSLSLRLAQSKLGSDPHAADELMSSASVELALALEELRELARGIHPAVLTERGLGPALESLANRATLPVELVELPEERLPGRVEAAAYYVVSEALANVGKYAEASAVSVRVAQQDGWAVVEVEDDGVGGADPSGGSGLRGLADRVEALEGRLAVESSPGFGTKVRAEIPCV